MKNKKALSVLFISNAISSFSQGIMMMAIPWYFTNKNMQDVFLLAYLCITFGSLFWGLYAGAIVDGFNRKDVFLGTNFIQGLIVISVASLGFKEGDLPNGLIILVFTTTFFGYYIHYPNLYAFAQEITEPEYYLKVTAYIEIVGQTTAMASAFLGGVLINGIDIIEPLNIPFIGEVMLPVKINRWELYEIILLNGITYMISFIVIIFINHVPIKQVPHEEEEGNIIAQLKAGYDFLRNNPLVSVFGLCSYSIFIISLIEIFAIRPMYIKNHLEADAIALGITELMFGFGSLVSGVIIRSLMSKIPVPKSIIILTLLTTVAFYIVSFSTYLSVFYVFSFIVGFTNAGSRIFRVSYLFNIIPNELTGRANSIFNVVVILVRMTFIGLFMIPFFSVGSQVTYAYMILGTFTLVAFIVLIYLYTPLLKLTQKDKKDKKGLNGAQHKGNDEESGKLEELPAKEDVQGKDEPE